MRVKRTRTYITLRWDEFGPCRQRFPSARIYPTGRVKINEDGYIYVEVIHKWFLGLFTSTLWIPEENFFFIEEDYEIIDCKQGDDNG